MAFPKPLIYLLVLVSLGNTYGIAKEFAANDYNAVLGRVAGICIVISIAILLNGCAMVQGSVVGNASRKTTYISFGFLAIGIVAYLNNIYFDYFAF